MRGWGVRVLVVLTVLLCLGMGGYAGQVWWAKRIAERVFQEEARHPFRPFLDYSHDPKFVRCNRVWFQWDEAPWYGMYVEDKIYFKDGWVPRRTFYELLKLLTGEDLGNDPSVWEAWFRAHPDLVWDEKLKRLVERVPLRD